MKKFLLVAALSFAAHSTAADDRLNLDFASGTGRQIVVYADSAEFSGDGSYFIFKGSVEVIQDDIVFRSQEVVTVIGDGGSQLDTVRAVGGATLEWPDGTAESDFATYKVAEGRVGMYGNLSVLSSDGRLTGYGLVYDVEQDRGQVLKEPEFTALFRPDD